MLPELHVTVKRMEERESFEALFVPRISSLFSVTRKEEREERRKMRGLFVTLPRGEGGGGEIRGGGGKGENNAILNAFSSFFRRKRGREMGLPGHPPSLLCYSKRAKLSPVYTIVSHRLAF